MDKVAASDGDAVQSQLIQLVRMRFVEASWRWQPLDDDDRCVLQQLLPKLPELRYPISGDYATAFTEAYFRLGDRPKWVPDLVNAGALEQRKAEQRACVVVHMRQLFEEFEEGRVVAVDVFTMRVSRPYRPARSFLVHKRFRTLSDMVSRTTPEQLAVLDRMSGPRVTMPPRKPQASESPADTNKNAVGKSEASVVRHK